MCGPIIWNSFLNDIEKQLLSEYLFKRKIKEKIFEFEDGGVGDKGEGDIGADIGADTFGRRHWRKIIIITVIHFMTIDFDLSTKYKRDIRLHNEI